MYNTNNAPSRHTRTHSHTHTHTHTHTRNVCACVSYETCKWLLKNAPN
uniref:Uncharacterized protein n=1 Tax=Anguilla anguilla TaxID=7936 RepID=A0A0E9RZ50_ANGAN